MKNRKVYLMAIIVLVITLLVSLVADKNRELHADFTNVKKFTEIELDNSNNYFCTQARSRGASEQYLFSNWCE